MTQVFFPDDPYLENDGIGAVKPALVRPVEPEGEAAWSARSTSCCGGRSDAPRQLPAGRARLRGRDRGRCRAPLDGIAELRWRDAARAPLASPPLSDARPLAELTFRPLVPRPGKIVCVGLNYLDHVGETEREIPEYPVLFTKFADALVGPFDPIAGARRVDAVDYEGELAVSSAHGAAAIAARDALAHVAGYTIANDVTMRDYQYKTHQWLRARRGALDAAWPVAGHARRGRRPQRARRCSLS